MKSVYLTVDPKWSYDLLKGIRDELYGKDIPTFVATIYNHAADYVRLNHNFRCTLQAVLFNRALDGLWRDLELLGDLPVPFFQNTFRLLYTTHLASFTVLTSAINTIHIVTNDNGELTGFVVSLDDY